MTTPDASTQRLKFGSLFSGVGGLDLGLCRAGMTPVFHVEADAYCRSVLHRHWPNVPLFDDVRTAKAATLPPCDVLVGGFPCQDISSAGRRTGIAGARSGLWKEFARLIGELQPSYVLIENVSALLHRGGGLAVVLSDLSQAGYDAEWCVVSAAAVGAPHLRERCFVVAYPGGVGFDDDVLPLVFEGDLPQVDAGWPPNHAAWCLTSTRRAYPGLSEDLRTPDGFPAGLDDAARRELGAARMKACGNAVVPQVGEVVGRWLLRFHAQRLAVERAKIQNDVLVS